MFSFENGATPYCKFFNITKLVGKSHACQNWDSLSFKRTTKKDNFSYVKIIQYVHYSQMVDQVDCGMYLILYGLGHFAGMIEIMLNVRVSKNTRVMPNFTV